MPDFSQVIQDINQKIIPNDNQEITANVLRPILIDMLTQSNELIGVLSGLNIPSPDNNNLVSAVNYVLDQIPNFSIYTGSTNPNISAPTLNPVPFDFYIRTGTTSIYIYDGNKWVLVSDDYISYSNVQSLTQPQKDTALLNIGGLAVDMVNLPSNLTQVQKDNIQSKLGVGNYSITSNVIGTGNAITDIIQPNPNINYLEFHKGLSFEETSNKQNNLNTDGTGTKYPTVDAVSTLKPIYHHFSGQTTVVVNHNRGMYASVSVMLGTEVVFSNIDQDVSMNTVTVNFSQPQTGIVILNF